MACYNPVMDKLPLYADAVSAFVRETEPVVKIEPRCAKFLVFQGVEIPVVDDMLDMLEEFKDCDGYMSRFVFNGNMGVILENAGLATRSSRGSYSPTQLFRDVYDQLVEKTIEVRGMRSYLTWKPTESNIQALPEPIREYIEALRSSHQA